MKTGTLVEDNGTPIAKASPIEKGITLVYAVSYEERGFESLKRTLEKFRVIKALVILFNVEDYLEQETVKKWQDEKRRVLSLLENKKVPITALNAFDSDFTDTIGKIQNEIVPRHPVVVDISTLPRNYILKISQQLDVLPDSEVLYLYTRGRGYRKPTEQEKRVGVSKIVPVDGFEGDIQINQDLLLTMILGFEGNRAIPFLSEFPSSRVLALIGAPGVGMRRKNDEDRYYLDQARDCNRHLLNNSFVEVEEVNSLNPILFSQQLASAIEIHTKFQKSVNIIVVPMGTKIQTLGLYLYWKSNPKIQVLYPVPNLRPVIALESSETRLYHLER